MTIGLFHNNSWQTVIISNATHPIARRYTDVDGNVLAVLDVPPELDSKSRLILSIGYEIESSDRPEPHLDPNDAGSLAEIPLKLVDEFCIETETFATRDESIQALANGLVANQTNVLDSVMRILDWFVENVSYCNFEIPLYPNETLLQGKGDCDDQAILLVTMCRTLGIPAFLQIGLVLNEGIENERTAWNGHLHLKQKGIGWHGWAVVFIPPWGWLPIDMTMLNSKDALSRIVESPEYKNFIITSFNVSSQAYIGDSHLSRERLVDSDLYITIREEFHPKTHESLSSPLIFPIVITILISVVVIILRFH